MNVVTSIMNMLRKIDKTVWISVTLAVVDAAIMNRPKIKTGASKPINPGMKARNSSETPAWFPLSEKTYGYGPGLIHSKRGNSKAGVLRTEKVNQDSSPTFCTVCGGDGMHGRCWKCGGNGWHAC